MLTINQDNGNFIGKNETSLRSFEGCSPEAISNGGQARGRLHNFNEIAPFQKKR
jgi:hypothetical protein